MPDTEPGEESIWRTLKRAPSGKSRTQPRDRTYVETEDLQSALERIRQVACRDKELRFTSLWHHVTNIDRLRQAYFGLKRNAAPGVDGLTWQQYGESLEENLQDLSARLKRGAYRAKPVRRAYIPKADGRQRPLGVTALEDKIVQRSTVQVLNAIYETDFLGFSYGFRPGRSPHHALDALYVGIMRKRVNWVLDADVCGFFDAIDHKWLLKFIEHRIADPRVIRHLKKWLKAGIVEDGKRTEIESGTPQGGSVSPVLANVYLHYVFDLWADQWRRRHARGDVIIVRFADDFTVGFEFREDAERFSGRLAGPVPHVSPGTAPRQNALDRVRAVRRSGSQAPWRREARVFRLPGFYAHVRQNPEREIHRAAADHAEAHASENCARSLASFGIACMNPSR